MNMWLQWLMAMTVKSKGRPALAIDEVARTPFMVLPTDIDGDLVADGSGFALYVAGEPFFFEGALPANTVWTLRTYHGEVTRNSAGTYAFNPTHRNPAVPGLLVQVNVTAAAQIVAAEADLTRVHTVPDPYYVTSLFDLSPTRYYQLLNQLIDSEDALAHDPMLIKRLRRQRDCRQRSRSARRLGIEL